jgi:hypothetical protein
MFLDAGAPQSDLRGSFFSMGTLKDNRAGEETSALAFA